MEREKYEKADKSEFGSSGAFKCNNKNCGEIFRNKVRGVNE